MIPATTNGHTAQVHRILVVDDEELVLAVLRATLARQPYEVVTTSDPLDALEKIKGQEFSVIISDHRMPGLSGLELLSRARQIQPHSSRILITAVLSLDMVIDAINQGEVYRFIVKPWLREEFLVTVKNAAQRYELVRQNQSLQDTTQAMNSQLVALNQSLEQQIRLVEDQNQKLATLNEELEQNLFRSIQLCLHTMRTYYPALGSQAQHSARLCHCMADVLRLPNEERRILESAAWLHDIGLVGVPRRIIRRWQQSPESLDDAQRALIEQHPVLGQELANFHRGMDRVGVVIRAHHERYDGKGYPDGLSGENIPWLGRLLAVAVACSSGQTPLQEATDQIRHQAGTAFDPEAVRVLLRALPAAEVPRRERAVQLDELRPGMVLARGIYTASGLLLLPEGQPLNNTCIEKILNHSRVQPITKSLAVYC